MRRLFAAAALLSIIGCGSTRYPADSEMRLARDLPDLFRFELPLEQGLCHSPAIDPRDDARFTLVRSSSGRGDYEVPGGRYGATSDELLRISCATGRAVGLVPR